jgi:hypothetical protein
MFLRTDAIASINILLFDKDIAEGAVSAHVALAVFVRAVGKLD